MATRDGERWGKMGRDGGGMEEGWRRDGGGMGEGWGRDGEGMEKGRGVSEEEWGD